MKRKVYATDRERKVDQVRGALAFPLVNVVLGAIVSLSPRRTDDSTGVLFLLLPWIVNVLVLVLAFLFRPEIGTGYIVSIAFTISAALALGVLFVVACVISLPGWALGPVGPVLFFVLLGIGFIKIAGWAFGHFQNWLSPLSEEAEGGSKTTDQKAMPTPTITPAVKRELSNTLQRARESIQQGDKTTAQQLLLQVIKADPCHETAWLWLSAIVDDQARKRECLERVMAINPLNEVARSRLQRLDRLQQK
jgi:hypothetical protein